MTTFLKWLNSPLTLGNLIGVGVLVDVVLIGRAYDLTKSDWSGWVQALGSIAALCIAIYLAERQNRSARDLMKFAAATALSQRLGSVLAILDHAASQLKNVTDRIKGDGMYSAYRTRSIPPSRDLDRMLCTMALSSYAGKPQFADIVEIINRIPMHELGSFELVGAVFRAKEALERFDEHLQMAHAQGEDDYQDGPIWNGATVADLMLSGSRSEFKKAIEKLAETARSGTSA